MTTKRVDVLSYFSIEADLARLFGAWPEFVEGQEYDVSLRSKDGSEQVTIRLHVDSEAQDCLQFLGEGSDGLFERALGFAIYALAAHSDNLMVDRYDSQDT